MVCENLYNWIISSFVTKEQMSFSSSILFATDMF